MAYKQHFIEWFSGKQLPSYWNTHNRVGTGTFAMADSADGGFTVTVDTSTNAESLINFNGIHQYSHTGSVFTGVVKAPVATSLQMVGGGVPTTDLNHNYSTYRNSSGDTYKTLRSDDTSATQVDTDIPVDTDWTAFKLENKSSQLELSISGVLKSTQTSNKPTATLQPVMRIWSSGSSAKTGSIRYMECYNT
jgi:ABC-type Na+ efflux pump permease subunit